MANPDATRTPPASTADGASIDAAAGLRAGASGRATRWGRSIRRGWTRLAEGLPPTPFQIALATITGALVIAIGNAVAIAVTVPLPPGGLAVRAAHHGYDALQIVGLSATWGLAVAGIAFATRQRWVLGWLLTCLPAIAGMRFALGLHLERQADCVLGGGWAWLLHPTYVVLCGLAVPVAHLLGSAFSRTTPTAGVAVGLGLVGNAVTHLILRDDYPGVHAAIAWVAMVLLGSALAPRLTALLATKRRRLGLVATMVVAGVLALLCVPPNRIRLQLFREPGAVGAWLLARTVWTAPELPSSSEPVPPAYEPPEQLELPPLGPGFAKNPVVVFVSVEAFRADVLASGRYDAELPNLVKLREQGAYFPRAIGPGSQTSVVLTSVFTGRYFSQLRWAKHGVGNMRFLYAAQDDAPRFPQLLTEAGVATESFLGLIFLGEHFGITRGFSRETMVVEDRRHAGAAELIHPLLARLRRVGREPFFAYVHLMEPHSPYDRGALKEGSEWDRYISEVVEVDRWIGRLVRLLQRRFRRRAYLVITGDHGEAFGEHGTRHHSKTLYDELVRVPLLLWGRGIEGRRHTEPAGLIDVGPTVMHLFRQPLSPGQMGQSLLPVVKGEVEHLDRPLVAEGRLRQAMFQRDGLKVIEDTRRKTVEVYDLTRDPGETRNLFDDPAPPVVRAVARSRAFFDKHRLRASGYRVPFKR